MNICKIIISLYLSLTIFSCSDREKIIKISVNNILNVERSYETIELTKNFLKVEKLINIGIRDVETKELQITQTVDEDGDGILDKILFQPHIQANSIKDFEIVKISDSEKPLAPELCYSRFVPERTDDYTWENNKVAFRVFGPTAQKLAEDNIPGGTLSSGVDAWLKRVEHSIINNWYKKELETKGTYHEDTGEGLDNFHVGISRGVGGLAVKVDSTYYYSKNFINYRTITTGPIRTSFYLEYANWHAGEKTITESKIISLDRGSHFSKFDVSIYGTDNVSVGLTLHEKDGDVKGNEKNGWVSYWQPHGKSELGTGIIAPKNTFLGFEKYDVETKDLSNVYAHLKVNNSKTIYYAGFGWKESGLFNNKQEWEDYLFSFSRKINNPLEVSLKQ